MVDAWMDVLVLRPLPAIHRQTDRRMAILEGAALLLGDVREYQHIRQGSPDVDLPGHDDDSWHDSVDRAVLAGLLNQVLGHLDDAIARYEWVLEAASTSPDALGAAAILGSMALADANDLERSLAFVERAFNRLDEGAHRERALLGVHRTVRLAALGRWADAWATAKEAPRLNGDDEFAVVVRRSSRANDVLFRWHVDGQWIFDDTQPDPMPPTFRWRLGQLASATSEILEADLRDQYMTASSSDWNRLRRAADHPLWSLSFNDQCRGHIDHATASLSALGRHRAISAAITDTTPSVDDYQAMLDGADPELARVVRRFVHRGPIEGLQELAVIASTRPWESVHTKATLNTLSVLAQLLDVERADDLVARLVGFIGEERPWDAKDAAASALATTLAAASDAAQTLCGARLLEWLDDADFDRAIDRLSNALRWEAVAPAVRTTARRRVERWAAGEGQAQAIENLLLPLSNTAAGWGRAQATLAFDSRPNLRRAAFLLDAGTKATDILGRVRDLAVEQVTAEIDGARAGRYGFGGIDAALVLTVALLRLDTDHQAWSLVAQFLSDPRVLARSKHSVLDAIAISAPEMHDDAVEIVRGALQAGLTGEAFFGDESPHDLSAAVMRAAMATGQAAAAPALDHMRHVAGSIRARDRVEAARSLPMACSVLPVPQVVDLGMQLLWDGDHEVRGAAAGNMIGVWQRRRIAQESTSALTARLNVLLRDDGTTTPIAILRRLPSLTSAKRMPFVDAVVDVRTRAASAIVRGAALHVAKRWRLDLT